MVNFVVPPEMLHPFVPAGTELDFWNGKCYVSLVGFLFLKTRVFGISVPMHRNFEEVNLRFYVRRQTADGWRRGVVFIKEIVPRRAIAWTARTFYNENYIALPMRHRLELENGEARSVLYTWLCGKGGANLLTITTRGAARSLPPNSEAVFIAEHYWGYSRQRDGSTLEYQVEHPSWRVQEASSAKVEGDFAELYGRPLAEILNRPPASAFLAEGSPVIVRKGARLE
jgi:uncharacterized protein YqjF (DUF2071 family)